jgi:hypothetical protein
MNLTCKIISAGCLILLTFNQLSAQDQGTPMHRLTVLTDIEADPDDAQSMVRLLLYSNVIDIEGLIATTSTHQRDRVAPESIHEIIDAYGTVHANLQKNAEGFPTDEELHRLVTQGLPLYGMQGVGEGHDSGGSELIIRALEKEDPRPLWVAVWGGPNTLAQALWKIRETRTKAEAQRLISKLRVYTISDQDDSGPWMRKTFPGLFYIVSPGSYLESTWIAIGLQIDGANNKVISNDWIADNIQQGHGALGLEYPDVAYLMEGDTPTFLSLIPNGLNTPNHPDAGGWGGRYERYIPDTDPSEAPGISEDTPKESRPIWTDAADSLRPFVKSDWGRPVVRDSVEYTGNKVTLWRWREEVQNDFAARMDWTVQSFEEANHPPVAKLAHKDTLTVKSGERFELSAEGSYDPDGDSISYLWFQYDEAGTYNKKIDFAPYAPNLYHLHTIYAPIVERLKTAHFILKVTDKGDPPLSRYRRVVVRILPE